MTYVERLAELELPQKVGRPAQPPPAPDYCDPHSWAASMHIPGASADVFFIHPTTSPVSGYHGSDWSDLVRASNDATWNQAIDDQTTQSHVHDLLKSQASVFAPHCCIYAPRYRQASILTLAELTVGDVDWGRRTLEIAYSDVERAFAHFLAEFNGGRPFILAGHSQGALHGLQLLKDYVTGTELADRMAGAYLIGIDVTSSDLSEVPDIPPCWKAGTPGTLIAYKCWRSSAECDGAKDNVTVNPAQWDPEHQSSELTEAVVRDGILRVSIRNEEAFVDWPGDAGNLHAYDFALFRKELRANVGAQIRNLRMNAANMRAVGERS